MARYVRRRVVVDAVRWDGDATTANRFLGECYTVDWEYVPGTTTAWFPRRGYQDDDWCACPVGDWLVRHDDRVWAVEADAFAALYEPIADDNGDPETFRLVRNILGGAAMGGLTGSAFGVGWACVGAVVVAAIGAWVTLRRPG